MFVIDVCLSLQWQDNFSPFEQPLDLGYQFPLLFINCRPFYRYRVEVSYF